MKTAQEVLQCLETSPSWVNRIVQQFADSKYFPYDTTAMHLFREVTIRKPTGRTNRFGREALKRYRLDGVAVIRINAHRYTPVLCGIEVKVTESDLAHDDKMREYCSHVDTFYLAVPGALVKSAQAYVRYTGIEAGILAVAEGVQVVKLGANFHNGEQQQKEMCCELLMKALWKEAEQVR